MEKMPQRRESVEKVGKTKILMLSSSIFGETSGGTHLLQIDSEFDIKTAKEQFDAEIPSDEMSYLGDARHEEFAKWLIDKGMAREVDVVPFHEGN